MLGQRANKRRETTHFLSAILTLITKHQNPSMISFSPYFFTIIGAVFLLFHGGPSPAQSFSFSQSPKKDLHQKSSAVNHPTLHLETFNTAPQQVSITDLLTNSQAYHEKLVSVRGRIIQPELHLDETELYLDFVFRLSQGTHSLVVYGRHDRTQGAPPIIINPAVEVIGTFWKDQNRKGLTIFNALEAFSVTPYPSSIPGST